MIVYVLSAVVTVILCKAAWNYCKHKGLFTDRTFLDL